MKTQPIPPAADAHMPTPYFSAIDLNGFPGLTVQNVDGLVCRICRTEDIDDEAKATAAFIVRACNEYDADKAKIAALVEALGNMLSLVDELTAYYAGDVANDPQSDAYAQREKARAALEQARNT